MRPLKGLRERIQAARTAEDITLLLQEGALYRYPSERTRRRWYRTAEQRRAELDGSSRA